MTTTFKRRRCRACRYVWDWDTENVQKPRCPQCDATQDVARRRRRLCLRCGYAWDSTSRRKLVRCPSCGLTAEPKFLGRPIKACPRCKHQWHDRGAHPKRPRCPSCFLNLKTLAGRDRRGRETSFADAREN